jgi:hypothetical protein
LDIDYVIQYKRGEKNKVADVLSRRVHDAIEGIIVLNSQWIEKLKANYQGDPWA